MKLKLNTGGASKPGSFDAGAPAATPTPSSGGGFKIKLKSSAPPTPATENPPQYVAPLAPPPSKPAKRAYIKKPKVDAEDGSKTSKKRSAADDISPAAKRADLTVPTRKFSLKLGGNAPSDLVTPTSASSAAPKIKLGGGRKVSGPKNLVLTTKRRPPPRPIGVGYDSEASDAETDPAIEQQFILRMQPGDDCDYVREAIANKTMGLKPDEGGADVSLKFVDKELRRAVVSVRGKKYAAVMVDLPCIVEGMKSWDKRGWWKVADICQLLLVLGPCATREPELEARNFPLPSEVDKQSLQYAHGLTPPMHWVRKRRFRKRVSYREIENVEEEVEKLLREDANTRKNGGTVDWEIYDRDAMRDAEEQQTFDEEMAEAGYVETTEDGYGQAIGQLDEDEDDLDEADLAEQLEAGLAESDDDEQPAVAADAAASLGGILSAETPSSATQQLDTSAAQTPATLAQDGPSSDDASSDYDDDDDDEASPDTIDEDALALQQDEARKREEIEDLVREVDHARADYERSSNVMFQQRARQKLESLEDELLMKRKAFNMEVDE